MSVIYDKRTSEPATHALIIGVGAYRYLPGGSSKKVFPDHGGLGQLSSPPLSALAVATWLLSKYKNREKPIASVDLLISDQQEVCFTRPQDGVVKIIRPAKFASVERAIQGWMKRGDGNPKNLMIFYFCGHGVSRGLINSLLLDDFGENYNNPLRQAINFHEFYSGMDTCKAREQWYLIDACRVASPSLIERYNNYAGEAIIPGSAYHSIEGKRYSPVYYATVPGESAYGRDGQTSVFTEALIKSMDGAGSDNPDGDWRVETDTLNRGIDFLMRRMIREAEGLEQVFVVDGLARFPLHYLEGKPQVPVVLGCLPTEANEFAKLSWTNLLNADKVQYRSEMLEEDWEIDLEAGNYCFKADFSPGKYRSGTAECHVRPPYRKVPLEVQ